MNDSFITSMKAIGEIKITQFYQKKKKDSEEMNPKRLSWQELKYLNE